MATISILTPQPNVLVINQSIDGSNANGVITTNVSIDKGFDHTVGVMYIERGLTGLVGPSGFQGVQGIIGETGPAGPSGVPGPSGMHGGGMNNFFIGDISVGDQEILNITGDGGTSITFDSNSKTVNIYSEPVSLQYAPIVHTHVANQIINFNEAVDDRVSSLLVPGSNVELNYQDQDFNSLTLSVTGLDIGTYTQAYSDRLEKLSNLQVTHNSLVCGTGLDLYGTIPITEAGRILINDASSAAQRETLGLGNIATHDAEEFAKLYGGNSFTGNQVLGDGQLTRFSAAFSEQVNRSYVINQSDNGKVISLNNALSINVSFDSELNVGFNCLIAQLGAGQVRLSGTQIANRLGHNKLVGQYSVATLVKIAEDKIILSGDTTDANGGS